MTNTCSVRGTRGAGRSVAVRAQPIFFGVEESRTREVPRGFTGSIVRPTLAAVLPLERTVPLAVVRRPSRVVVIRRRALLAAVAAAMLVMLALPWGGTGGRTLATPGAAPVGSLVAGTSYVVRNGDTLWGIAERLADGSDPRPIVAQLEAQNGGDTLRPGELLHLP